MDHPGLVTEALAMVMNVPYGDTLTVDLTDLQKVSAFGLATLGARVAWLVAAKRLPSGSVIRRPESGRISNDLMRMGLYRLMQEGSVAVFQGNAVERPQELWMVMRPEDSEDACQRMVNILRSIVHASDADYVKVNYFLRNLVDNVFRHGQVHTGAMLCVQGFPKAGYVEFAVADTGQGILASLRRFDAMAASLKDDSQAVLTALTLKISQKDDNPRPGFLNALTATCRKTGGEFVCLSGDAAISLRQGEMRNLKVPFYPGTTVGVRLRLVGDRPLDDTAPAPLTPPPAAPAP